MTTEPSLTDPRIRAALAEFRELILARYPDATFVVTEGDDPVGIYRKAIVDADDADDVLDVVMDRLLEVQVDEYLPVYVIPLGSPARTTVSASRRVDPQAAPAMTTVA